jgi:hypothetical protein
MKNEVNVMENDLSVIEQNHRNQILAMHENMQELIQKCQDIQVFDDDKASYDNAVELKRLVKNVHVSIDKKRKELKQPVIDYGKKLDAFVKEIYEPLVEAEKLVKFKMAGYEARLEEIKEERKKQEELEKEHEIMLENKIREINNLLAEINSATNKQELIAIENILDAIDINSFGKKSADVGFIVNQMKLTCSMAMRTFKDEVETLENKNSIGEEIPEDISIFLAPRENVQKVLIKDENGIFDEISLPINQSEFNPLDNVQEDVLQRMNDNEIFDFVNDTLNKIYTSVQDSIVYKIKSELSIYHHAEKKSVKEHEELLIEAIVNRIGIKLNEFKIV